MTRQPGYPEKGQPTSDLFMSSAPVSHYHKQTCQVRLQWSQPVVIYTEYFLKNQDHIHKFEQSTLVITSTNIWAMQKLNPPWRINHKRAETDQDQWSWCDVGRSGRPHLGKRLLYRDVWRTPTNGQSKFNFNDGKLTRQDPSSPSGQAQARGKQQGPCSCLA